MAYTTIDDPSAYFHTTLYTGNDTARAITNDGNSDLQPDLVWIKSRNATGNHGLFDSSRGVNKRLAADEDSAELTGFSNLLTAFSSDGFSLGNDSNNYSINENSTTFVAWQWKANGGSRTTFNESGDNPGGGHQANTTAGFSIIDYTGTGQTAGDPALVPHGLGVAPDFIIVKQRDATRDWNVFHHKNTSAPETDFLVLNTTAATVDASNRWNDTAPNATNVVLGDTARVNNDAGSYIMYAFAEVKGYSKFGQYIGNGNNNGPFLYTGFKPAMFFRKRTNGANNWNIWDSKRAPFNEMHASNALNTTDAEDANTGYNDVDFLSNGIKIHDTGDSHNGSDMTYVYAAFAENPFVTSTGVPTTAR
jgi:hypothetical protein